MTGKDLVSSRTGLMKHMDRQREVVVVAARMLDRVTAPGLVGVEEEGEVWGPGLAEEQKGYIVEAESLRTTKLD